MKFDLQQWKISALLENAAQLAVPSFQREPDIWDDQRKKLLIDSLLREWRIPKIYLNNSKSNILEIIDGQQRIATILEYFNNRLAVKVDPSGEEYDFRSLGQKLQDVLLNYSLDVEVISDATDEEAALLFSRLQEGEVLNDWERLNAITGKLSDFIISMEQHDFFTKTGIRSKRYGIKGICQQICFLQAQGLKSAEFGNLRDYFERNIDRDDEPLKQNIRETLNFMDKIFTGGEEYLSRTGNILSIYLLCSWILDKKIGLHDRQLQEFFAQFFKDISKRQGDGDGDFITYNISLLQSNSAADSLKTRNDILRKHLCLKEARILKYLGGTEMQEFRQSIEQSLKEKAKRIHELVDEVNQRAIGAGKKKVLDLTAESSLIFSALPHPIRDAEEYGELVDLLWKAFYEGSSKGTKFNIDNDDRKHLKQLRAVNIVIKIDDLRKVEAHDLEHDEATYEMKVKTACDIRDLFTGKKHVQDFDANDFIVFQYKVTSELLDFMNDLNTSLRAT